MENQEKAVEIFESEIKQLISDSFTTLFPISECSHKDDREESILLSKEKYWVLSVDIRFMQSRILIASPYIFIDESDEVFYGWYYDGNYLSCAYNTIHLLDDEFVVAWKKYGDELK